uniref:Homeodomain-only protein n=1 Tax=Rhinolophus ferrumequinum TaxID=59479 RepID=A0A671E9A6_RHIFE
MSAETASGPTQDQVEILEYNFNKVNKHPDPTTLCLIAAEAGLSEEETQAATAGLASQSSCIDYREASETPEFREGPHLASSLKEAS